MINTAVITIADRRCLSIASFLGYELNAGLFFGNGILIKLFSGDGRINGAKETTKKANKIAKCKKEHKKSPRVIGGLTIKQPCVLILQYGEFYSPVQLPVLRRVVGGNRLGLAVTLRNDPLRVYAFGNNVFHHRAGTVIT
jgi:hypothetical protein